jgi:hypothetical protein
VRVFLQEEVLLTQLRQASMDMVLMSMYEMSDATRALEGNTVTQKTLAMFPEFDLNSL